MALINTTVNRLPFRRSWVYRDNLFFNSSTYSSFVGGAYFLPYVFKRLFDQRQFRDIETFFSHFLLKRFNNSVLHYQFFVQSRFFYRAYKAFQNEFFPHVFFQRRMLEGRGGMFKAYRLLSVLRSRERFKKRNKTVSSDALSSSVKLHVANKMISLKSEERISLLGSTQVAKKHHNRRRQNVVAITKQSQARRAFVKNANSKKAFSLPSDRVIAGLYRQLSVENHLLSPRKLKTAASFRKQNNLLTALKTRFDRLQLGGKNSFLTSEKKKVRLISFYNKRLTSVGAKLQRRVNSLLLKRKHILQLDKQKFIAFQTFIRFFEYNTRTLVFNHYRAAILKTLSSYFQNSGYRYIIDFKFLSLKTQNVYQMLRFITSRLTQGGNIKHVIRSTQRFYETKGARTKVGGIKLVCSGRFSRQQRAQRLILTSGKVPLNTVSAKIDYATSTLRLKYGSSTVKMWLSYE